MLNRISLRDDTKFMFKDPIFFFFLEISTLFDGIINVPLSHIWSHMAHYSAICLYLCPSVTGRYNWGEICTFQQPSSEIQENTGRLRGTWGQTSTKPGFINIFLTKSGVSQEGEPRRKSRPERLGLMEDSTNLKRHSVVAGVGIQSMACFDTVLFSRLNKNNIS